MENFKKNSGFSLVELIIVIAVIVILTGIFGPQFIKYISKTKKAVCQTDMDTVVREYLTAVIDDTPAVIGSARDLLKDIMLAHGGAVESAGTSFYTGGVYSGLCRENGTYSCMLSSDLYVLSIDCSVHGEYIIDVKTLKERLDTITFDDIPGFKYADLEDYFRAHPNLDSEAVNTGDTGSYGPYGSLAKAVGAKLTQQGINTTDRSWRMYRRDSEYNLFLTDRKITLDDIASGEWIDSVKYDITKQEVISGKVQAVKSPDGNYPIISGSSFREEK